jgi:hypothetical protein
VLRASSDGRSSQPAMKKTTANAIESERMSYRIRGVGQGSQRAPGRRMGCPCAGKGQSAAFETLAAFSLRQGRLFFMPTCINPPCTFGIPKVIAPRSIGCLP